MGRRTSWERRRRAASRVSSCSQSPRPSSARSSTRTKRNGVEIKEEVAVWDRSGLTASTERLKTTTRLTLALPEGETIVCDAEGLGDNPWADDVIRALRRNHQPSGRSVSIP